jgi:transcription-repair coupling factor (superfamily II helicase)
MKVIVDIQARLKQKEVVKISQVPNDTSRAWLITEVINSPLIAQSGGFVVAENHQAAEKMYHNLLFWKSIKNLSIPIFLFSEHVSETLYYLIQQFPHIAIITSEEFKNSLPTPDDFKNTIANYSIGQSLTHTDIIPQLIHAGYSRQSKVFTVGEFALRGEIIDIYSPGYQLPVRIIFDHEKIADIFFFNPLIQLSDKKINTIAILPIQNLNGNATWYSYIGSHTILFGSTTLDIPHSNFPTIVWEQLENKKNVAIGFSEHLTFKYTQKELLTWLTQHQDWKIIFTSDEYNDWQTKFPHLQIKNGSFISGCKNEKIKLLIASEENLPKIYTDKNNLDTLVGQPFQLDEYVVHIDHGIGKFVGISVQIYDGIPKEFFELAYAANDKLFVPIEKIDRLSRYVGLAKPTLHRLSGTSWQQLKQKVKKGWIILDKIVNLFLNLNQKTGMIQYLMS